MTEHELNAEEKIIADALIAQRSIPAPAFRGALGDSLAGQDPGYRHRPVRLWAHVSVLVGVGIFLVLTGLLVSVGAI